MTSEYIDLVLYNENGIYKVDSLEFEAVPVDHPGVCNKCALMADHSMMSFETFHRVCEICNFIGYYENRQVYMKLIETPAK